jgi:transposase-like protein
MSRKHDDCLAYLEQVRWNGTPTCPYCSSTNSTHIKREQRYHCNECFNSYSVTVDTIFHKTHLDLSKWFHAINLIDRGYPSMSIRKLAVSLGVNKNTAALIIARISKERQNNSEMLNKIADFYRMSEEDG